MRKTLMTTATVLSLSAGFAQAQVSRLETRQTVTPDRTYTTTIDRNNMDGTVTVTTTSRPTPPPVYDTSGGYRPPAYNTGRR
jgi:hypothetical protein